MTDDLLQLAKDIIDMRKHPLKNNGARRYPIAAQQFDAAINVCEDMTVLREIIAVDTGHVLPSATKQHIFEKVLANDVQRTPDMLRAYGMHLVMFGYIDEAGMMVHDTDDMTDALFAEADQKTETGA